MPGVQYSIQIMGVEKLRAKLNPEAFMAFVRSALWKAALLVERKVKQETPVDTGRLRASFVSSVSSMPNQLWSKVSSPVTYASFVEEGTRPHWPPPGALAGWSHRHNIPEFLVARAIARRGTRAVRMLARAIEMSRQEIVSIFNDTGMAIQRWWNE